MRYRKNNSLKIPKWLHPGEKTIDVSAKQKGINSLDYFNYGFCAKEIEYTEAWSPIEIALLSDEDSNHPEEYRISQNEEKLLRKIYQGLDNQLLYIEPKDFNEESVIRTVLTPLLWMTGFYETPFHIRSEEQISFLYDVRCYDQHANKKVTVNKQIKGRLDSLVLHGGLSKKKRWILVIEAKRLAESLDGAISQALTYMLHEAPLREPMFGLVTNGSNNIFIKLRSVERHGKDGFHYSTSNRISEAQWENDFFKEQTREELIWKNFKKTFTFLKYIKHEAYSEYGDDHYIPHPEISDDEIFII